MKNTTSTATNVGNIDVSKGEKTRIHPAAYGMLMDLLSGVYTYADEAVLREYACNGWDEHVKHGVTRPVEVSLPSTLQPTLEIRDFAKGIPLEGTYEIVDGERVCTERGAMEVFGEYGNSSKRDNDDEVGGFGIGSKAAFALGHQFLVTGYKDGHMFKVLFTLNQDGTGTKNVLHEGPTSEPNGVKVSLAVDDVDSMREAATRVFRYWERGTVLVDGEEPTPVFESLEKVNDETYINPDGSGQAFVVMGPVAYPVGRDMLRRIATNLERQECPEAAGLPMLVLNSSTDLFMRVPIGSVKPAPSREALRDKPITINTLSSVFLGLYQDSVTKVQNQVAQAHTYYEAVKTFEDANHNLGVFKVNRKSVSWNGQPIRKTTMVGLENYGLVNRSWRSDTKILGIQPHVSAEFPDVENWLTVTGVPEGDESKVRRYSKRFLEDNEDGITRVLVTPAESVSFGWFQVGIARGARHTDLDGWKAMLKAIRKASPRTVNEPSYSTGFVRATRDLEDRDLLSDIISEGKDLVLFHDSSLHLNKFEREVLADYTVVVLLGTQSEDALRKRVAADGTVEVVEWSSLKPLADAKAQAIVDTLTTAEREALGAADWLRTNRSSQVNILNVIGSLSIVGEVTSPALLGAKDSYLLAEEFATGITENRKTEVSVAYRALAKTLADEAVDYQDDSVDLSHLPLLDVSSVTRAASQIRKNSVVDEETSVRTYQPSTGWNSIQESSYDAYVLLLEHALAYVNSH